MNRSLLYSILVSTSFASWPILTRLAKLPVAWAAVLVNTGTVAISLFFLLLKRNPLPPPTALTVGLFAGIINGLGFILYSSLLSNSTDVSKIVTLVTVLIPVVATIGGIFLLKEPLDTRKVIGIFVICFGIYLLIRR